MRQGGVRRGCVGRRNLVENAVTLLSAEGASNVAVVGDAGIGKTALIHEVLARLESRCHVVHLRPSQLTASHQYGALSVLLEDYETGSNLHPVHIISLLGRILSQQAGDRPVLIVVDDAGRLDDFSDIVLNELAHSGAVQMLLTCRDFADIPAGLTTMWREGLLRRIDLAPLPLEECREYLERELEARVSAPVLHTLADGSGGNPLLLQAMSYELRKTHQMLLRDGIWVLYNGQVEYGAHASNAMSEILTDFSPAEMEIIDVLSLAGTLPLLLLLRITSGSDVDLLQEKGVLTVEQRREHNVHLSSELLGNSGSWRLGAGRRWQLYQKLRAAVDSENDLPLGSLRHGQWIVGFGGTLDPQLAYSAAHEANANSEPHVALQLAECTREPTTGVVAETVTAMAELGDYPGAFDLLNEFTECAATGGLAESTALKIAEARLLQHASRPGALQALQDAERQLQPALEFENLSPDLLYSHQALAVAQAGLASYEGRFADNAETLPGLYAAAGDNVNFKAQIGSLLCEAWAVAGHQDQSLELVDELLKLPTGSEMKVASRCMVLQHAAEARMLAGVSHNTELPAQGQDVTPRYPGAMPAELLQGLAEAHLGQTGDALSGLQSALSQLRTYDPFTVLPLATAAAAYCNAFEARSEISRSECDTSWATEGSWKMRRIAGHFNSLALAASGATTEAIEQLNLLAASDREQGAGAYEMLAYYHLARLGEISAPDRLLGLAGGTSGPFSELCTLYAKGLASQDPLLLTQAAELAQHHGNVSFCKEAADAALRVAAASNDRTQVRQIQRSLRTTVDMTKHHLVSNPLERLTAREREVAHRAAQGLSNKMIAAEMFVSIRTVEGHLYRLYSKLNVVNRSDLAHLISASTSSS